VGVRPTTAIAPDAKAEARKLDRLSGPAFDKAFATFMVAAHKKAISDYEEEANQHSQAAELARQTLPTLHKHLDMAASLAG